MVENSIMKTYSHPIVFVFWTPIKKILFIQPIYSPSDKTSEEKSLQFALNAVELFWVKQKYLLLKRSP
jgi:hypothetical protein